MARFTLSTLLKSVFLLLALPNIIAATDQFPYFTAKGESQKTADAQPANIHDCDALQSMLKRTPGTWTVGDFDINIDWQTIGIYQSCTLEFSAEYLQDALGGATWTIGDNDAYNLIIDAVMKGFVDDKGAMEGEIPCQHTGGVYVNLLWRIEDSRPLQRS